MKILLTNLPSENEVLENSTPDYLLYDFFRFPPLGLMAIASGISKEHSVDLLDVSVLGLSLEQAVGKIGEMKPDILGISVVTRRYFAFTQLIRQIRALLPDVIIVAGGPHINYFARESMENSDLDYALPGFCEEKFPALLEAIATKGRKVRFVEIPGLLFRENGVVIEIPESGERAILDQLPFPRRDLLNLNDYVSVTTRTRMTTTYTSRGCPFQCIFCDVQEKKFHFRSAKNIVDEFEQILTLGIEEIHIFDDTFNFDRERVINMCREILRRKLKVSWSARVRVAPMDREMLSLMKESGCNRLHVGVESFDPDLLTFMKKGVTLPQILEFFRLCRELRIETLAYFIIGFPGETEKYRQDLFKKIRRLRPTYVYVNILYPLPNTKFYQQLLAQNILKKDYWNEFVHHPSPAFSIPLWREESLQKELFLLADSIHRQFMLSPKFILQELRRTESFKMFLLKAKVAILMFFKIILRKFRL